MDAPKKTGRRLLSSSILPPVVIVVEGLAALTSSGNKGSGFILPLVPAMFLVASWALIRLTSASETFIAVVAALALFLTLPMSTLALPFAKPWAVNVPLLGSILVSDGRGNIQNYESAGGYSSAKTTIPRDPLTGSRWIHESATASTELNGQGSPGGPHPFFEKHTTQESRGW